jgi:alpha-D-ribose 1-methylphosphonate 5-triphosphate synthase subunit PhnI
VLAGIAGAFVVSDLTHGRCRPVRASDVPVPTVASATSPADRACAKAIIEDWYGDRVVDRRFPLRCYGFALARLPTGKDFSTVGQDITRAYTQRYHELHRGQRLC